MVDHLTERFKTKSNPNYVYKEIDVEYLEETHWKGRLNIFPTIDGSSLFQVAVFQPNFTTFRAARYLCVCEMCMRDYGLCSLFTEYQLSKHVLKETSMRSDYVDYVEPVTTNIDTESEFLLPGSTCAIAAAANSSDTVWLMRIEDQSLALTNIIDDYGHSISAGQQYLTGQYLEKRRSTKKGHYYKLS